MHHPVRRVIAIVSVLLALVCLQPAPRAHAGINAWTQTGLGALPGAFYGNARVYALTINPHTPTTLYAGTENGFFRSTDNGATWQVRGTDTITHSMVTEIVVDPHTPTTLYALVRGIIYRSTDNGEHWEQRSPVVPPPGSFDYMYALVIDPRTPTHLYALNTQRDLLYQTTDSGVTWQTSNIPFTTRGAPLALARLPDGSTLLYAGDRYSDVYMSRNLGATWTHVLTANFARTFPVDRILVDPATPTTVYANYQVCYSFGEEESACESESWRSKDSGTHWEEISFAPLLFTEHDPPEMYAFIDRASSSWDRSKTLARSRDNGATWIRQANDDDFYLDGYDSGLPLAASAQDPPTLYVSLYLYESGLRITADDGVTWRHQDISDTLYPSATTLAISPSAPLVRYAVLGDQVYTSIDGGNTLHMPAATAPFTSTVRAVWVDPQHADTVYASTSTNLYRSIDQARTWTPLNQVVSALVIDPHTSSTLYAIRHAPSATGQPTELVRSTDNGSTWSSALLATLPPFTTTINALALNSHTPSTLYAGTTHGLYRSGDAGTTWQPLTTLGFTSTVGLTGTFTVSGTSALIATSGLSATLDIRAIATNPLTLTTLYVGTAGNGVYRSRDDGTTWQPAGTGLPTSATIQRVVVNPRAPGVLYALLNDNSVYRSRDDGDTWSAVQDGLSPTATINDLVTGQDGSDTVYVATDAGLLARTFVPADQVSQLFVPLVSR